MWLYAVTTFLGAYLLFQVQPIIARYILPWFGGTPSVWTTCMLFFQIVLLAGYGYAHLIASRLNRKAQIQVHIGVICLAAIALIITTLMGDGAPIAPGVEWKPEGSDAPIGRILVILSLYVGLPYFIVCTVSPLIQSWFGRAFADKSPYRLYALSNVGSLLGLLAYPFVIEPNLRMGTQALMWSVGYALFLVFYAATGIMTLRRQAATASTLTEHTVAEIEDEPTLWRRFLWLALPALSCTFLLAITNQVSQEVSVSPFLWIAPLSLYLISFILCFESDRWYIRWVWAVLLLAGITALTGVLQAPLDISLKLQVPLYLGTLFAGCMLCHGELVLLRPGRKNLTAFYLSISAGGAMGGLFVGLLAPQVFPTYWELSISMVLCYILAVITFARGINWGTPLFRYLAASIPALVAICIFIIIPRMKYDYPTFPYIGRNFYGVMRVREDYPKEPERHRFTLVHGTIVHGFQYFDQNWRNAPVSYYAEHSGIGLAFQHHPKRWSPEYQGQGLNIAVVGLGTGQLAAWANKGDFLRMYEINPDVLELSERGMFSYLNDCKAEHEVIMGDGRISLELEVARKDPVLYDLLILDAFSSDAVPSHLLTKEAFEVYLQRIAPKDGIIAVHISNRWVDLKPVVYYLADELNLKALFIEAPAKGERIYATSWFLLTRSDSFANVPEISSVLSKRAENQRVMPWTDDFHNLLQILR